MENRAPLFLGWGAIIMQYSPPLYKLFAEVTQLFLIFYSIEFLSANKLCQL